MEENTIVVIRFDGRFEIDAEGNWGYIGGRTKARLIHTKCMYNELLEIAGTTTLPYGRADLRNGLWPCHMAGQTCHMAGRSCQMAWWPCQMAGWPCQMAGWPCHLVGPCHLFE